MNQVAIKRLIAAMLIAVVLGPLVNGALAVLAIFVVIPVIFFTHGIESFTFLQVLAGASVAALYYVLFSYYVGTPIALIAGLLVGFVRISWRPPNLPIALAAAVLASCAWIFVRSERPTSDLLLILPASLVAAAGCWLLCRRYVSRI